MTGSLLETMHRQADLLDAWDVDLDQIQHEGGRRMRRRRAVLAGGLVAALVVVAGTGIAVRGRSTEATPARAPQAPLAYAVGDVIHVGQTRVDVGRKVATFVSTTRGIVFADAQGRVYGEQGGRVQRLQSVEGVPSRLAHPGSPLLVSDDGLVAAWLDRQGVATWPGYVGEATHLNTVLGGSTPTGTPPSVRAVSDGHLIWWSGRGTWIADAHPLTTTQLWRDRGLSGAETVQDAAGDRLLVRVGDGLAVVTADYPPRGHKRLGWEPGTGTDLSGVSPQVTGAATGNLAPDARHWFSADHDDVRVYDSSTGQGRLLNRDGYAVAVPYQWLDNDTIAAAGFHGADESGPVSLLTCRLSTDSCQVARADVGRLGDVALPDGVPLGKG